MWELPEEDRTTVQILPIQCLVRSHHSPEAPQHLPSAIVCTRLHFASMQAAKGRPAHSASCSSCPSQARRRGTCVHSAKPSETPSTSGAVNVVVEHLDEYRPNVGVCIVNSEGMVFAAQRLDDKSCCWQMPQGERHGKPMWVRCVRDWTCSRCWVVRHMHACMHV